MVGFISFGDGTDDITHFGIVLAFLSAMIMLG